MKVRFCFRRVPQHFWHDDRGGPAIEYALVAAGIAMAVVASYTLIGTGVYNMFNTLASHLP